jgi:hypothetical protein
MRPAAGHRYAALFPSGRGHCHDGNRNKLPFANDTGRVICDRSRSNAFAKLYPISMVLGLAIDLLTWSDPKVLPRLVPHCATWVMPRLRSGSHSAS